MATENIEFVLTARNATQAAFDRVRQSLGEIGEDIGNVAARATALIAAAGLIALKFGEMADKLDTSRTLLGVHAQTLRDWQHVASQSNIEGDQLVSMLQRLQRSAGEAASGGNAQLVASFEALGISQEDLQGKLSNLEQLYPAVLDGLRNLNNGFAEAKLAQDVLGKSGQALLPVVRQSKEDIDNLTEAFHRNAGVLTDEQVKALADAKDKWDGFIDTLKNRGLTTFAEAADLLERMQDATTAFFRENRIGRIGLEIEELQKKLNESKVVDPTEFTFHKFLNRILPDFSDPVNRAEIERRIRELETERQIINEAIGRGEAPDTPPAPVIPQTLFIDPEVAAKEAQTERLNALEDIRTQYARTQAEARLQGEIAANSLAIEALTNFEQDISASVQRGVDLQKAADKQRLLSASQSAVQHLAIATSGSKALFAVSKAAALADAVINTYKAVQVARASAPPPYNYVLAAIELAAGLANVAAIASASFGSGSGVNGQSAGPGGLAPAIPEAKAPNVSTTPGEQAPNNVVLTVRGGDNAGRALLELLTVEVNQNDGVFIKPGSRQAAELAT